MSVQGNAVALIDLGFVDSGLGAPDPDQHDFSIQTLKTSMSRSLPFRLRCFLATKRGIDILVSAGLLIALSPLFCLLAVLVRLTSKGTVIYSQDRLTEGGRIFKMLKFRSMKQHAEEASGPVWAQESDPRVTPIGKFLRISHLDELPQLINVLVGDMSLIGPRPERPEIAAELLQELPQFGRRLAVKGGITGLAQVSAPYAASLNTYKEKLAYDLLYVKNQSLKMDVGIALKTVIVMITGAGAR